MKTTTLIVTILLTTNICWSQRPSLPIARPPRPNRPINRPDIVNGGDVLPAEVPTNMTETNPPEMETNGLMPTNELGATNAAETNAYNPELASAYALTNRLSVMAPAQVQGVLQVQSSLGSLQDAAEGIHGQQSVLMTINQNPQVQRRLNEFCDNIINLTRGQVTPSRDSVDRVSLDLLRACSHGRLARDHELILAIIINLTCNSERLSPADFDDAVNNGVMILRADGVTPAICNSFSCDLRSIALELQPNTGS